MRTFFDRLYYRIYFGSVDNGKAESFVILFISSCQTANVVTVLNAFFKITGLNPLYKITPWFFSLLGIAILCNIHYYEIKKNRKKIMESRKYDSEDNIIWHYLILSIFGIFFSSMIYTEL